MIAREDALLAFGGEWEGSMRFASKILFATLCFLAVAALACGCAKSESLENELVIESLSVRYPDGYSVARSNPEELAVRQEPDGAEYRVNKAYLRSEDQEMSIKVCLYKDISLEDAANYAARLAAGTLIDDSATEEQASLNEKWGVDPATAPFVSYGDPQFSEVDGNPSFTQSWSISKDGVEWRGFAQYVEVSDSSFGVFSYVASEKSYEGSKATLENICSSMTIDD